MKKASHMKVKHENKMKGNSEEIKSMYKQIKNDNKESLIFLGTQGIYFIFEAITGSYKKKFRE